MQNKQTLYLKITSLALVISLAITLGLGSVLFANKKKFIEVEERTSRIELERSLEKIISPHNTCNNSLKGIKIPDVGQFTDMDVLTFDDGEIAFKSNKASRSLYVEQIRLTALQEEPSMGKTLVEVSVPIRSKRSMLVKLETIKLTAYVQKDSSGRVAQCGDK